MMMMMMMITMKKRMRRIWVTMKFLTLGPFRLKFCSNVSARAVNLLWGPRRRADFKGTHGSIEKWEYSNSICPKNPKKPGSFEACKGTTTIAQATENNAQPILKKGS